MAKGHVLITGSSSGIGRAAIQKIRLMTDQPMILAFREKANIKEIADANISAKKTPIEASNVVFVFFSNPSY